MKWVKSTNENLQLFLVSKSLVMLVVAKFRVRKEKQQQDSRYKIFYT